jgi:hypothetical protein
VQQSVHQKGQARIDPGHQGGEGVSFHGILR